MDWDSIVDISLCPEIEASLDKVFKEAKFSDKEETENYKTLIECALSLAAIFHVAPSVKCYATSLHGYISVAVHEVEADANLIEKLLFVLRNCIAVEALPLVNGDVRLGFTIPNIYKRKT